MSLTAIATDLLIASGVGVVLSTLGLVASSLMRRSESFSEPEGTSSWDSTSDGSEAREKPWTDHRKVRISVEKYSPLLKRDMV